MDEQAISSPLPKLSQASQPIDVGEGVIADYFKSPVQHGQAGQRIDVEDPAVVLQDQVTADPSQIFQPIDGVEISERNLQVTVDRSQIFQRREAVGLPVALVKGAVDVDLQVARNPTTVLQIRDALRAASHDEVAPRARDKVTAVAVLVNAVIPDVFCVWVDGGVGIVTVIFGDEGVAVGVFCTGAVCGVRVVAVVRRQHTIAVGVFVPNRGHFRVCVIAVIGLEKPIAILVLVDGTKAGVGIVAVFLRGCSVAIGIIHDGQRIGVCVVAVVRRQNGVAVRVGRDSGGVGICVVAIIGSQHTVTIAVFFPNGGHFSVCVIAVIGLEMPVAVFVDGDFPQFCI